MKLRLYNNGKDPVGLICLASLLTWGITLTFGFVWDDVPTIVDNPSLQSLGTLFSAFTHDYWGLHQIPAQSGYWRPVPTVVYTLTALIFGKSPFFFHLVNVIVHMGVVWTVVRLFQSLSLSGLGLLTASFFFALHPIHSEPISFVSALPDLLAAFFGLTFLTSKGGRTRWAFLTLALLSKESSVIFPMVAWALGRLSKKETGISLAMIASYILIHFVVTGGVGARPLWGGTIFTHLGTVVKLAPFSALLTLIPFSTTPTRTFPVSSGLTDIFSWVALFTCVVVVKSGYIFRNKYRNVWLAIGLFFLFWLPVSNIIPAEGLITDRYLYLLVLGTAFLIGDLVGRLDQRFSKLRVAFGIFTLVWGIWALTSTLPWRDSEHLWRHAIVVSPKSPVAWNEWGVVQLGQSKAGASVASFENALGIRPDYKEAMLNLALAQYRSEDIRSAEQTLAKLIANHPLDAGAYDLRATILESKGLLVEAARESQRAAELAPRNWKYLYNWGTALIKTKEFSQAQEVFKRAYGESPDHPQILMNLAAAYVGEGNFEEAANVYKLILNRWPDYETAKSNLYRVAPEKK